LSFFNRTNSLFCQYYISYSSSRVTHSSSRNTDVRKWPRQTKKLNWHKKKPTCVILWKLVSKNEY